MPPVSPELLCDINESGELVELARPEHAVSRPATEGVLTDGGPFRLGSALSAYSAVPSLTGTRTSPAKPIPRGPAPEVLRLAVGLLGLDVHEKPQTWAEAWLTLQDRAGDKLGLGAEPSCPNASSPEERAAQMDWQQRVLAHLQALQAKSTSESSAEMAEQLQLSEFTLNRISYLVGVLQDKQRHDRPMLLQEFTEKMVVEVCGDLSQWLEQLSNLLSLYHVRILDRESECRRLQHLLELERKKNADGQKAQKQALLKHDTIKQRWEEDKMKRRAEALLGITNKEDAKIYSQKEADEMKEQWEEEILEPVLEELRELQAQLGHHDHRPGSNRKAATPGGHDGGASRQQLDLLATLLPVLAQRSLPQIGDLLHSAAAAIAAPAGVPHRDAAARPGAVSRDGSSTSSPAHRAADNSPAGRSASGKPDLNTLVQLASQLPPVCSEFTTMSQCMGSMLVELSSLEEQLQQKGKGGSHRMAGVVSWVIRNISLTKQHCEEGLATELQWDQAPPMESSMPQFEIGIPMGTQTDSTTNAASKNLDMELEVGRLKKELEAVRKQMQEKLLAEAKRHEAAAEELKRRIAELEKILQKAGLGKLAHDILGGGLKQLSGVFERLYSDALGRMQRLVEAQARAYEEKASNFTAQLMGGESPVLGMVRGLSTDFTPTASSSMAPPLFFQPPAGSEVPKWLLREMRHQQEQLSEQQHQIVLNWQQGADASPHQYHQAKPHLSRENTPLAPNHASPLFFHGEASKGFCRRDSLEIQGQGRSMALGQSRPAGLQRGWSKDLHQQSTESLGSPLSSDFVGISIGSLDTQAPPSPTVAAPRRMTVQEKQQAILSTLSNRASLGAAGEKGADRSLAASPAMAITGIGAAPSRVLSSAGSLSMPSLAKTTAPRPPGQLQRRLL